MKHAGHDALTAQEPLLAERWKQRLTERSRGVFYFRAKAFLHFHENAAGLFADVRLDKDVTCSPVDSAAQHARLLNIAREHLAAARQPRT